MIVATPPNQSLTGSVDFGALFSSEPPAKIMTDATTHRSPRLQLAIETTGKCGSIAILRDDVIIRAINLPETTAPQPRWQSNSWRLLKQHRDGSQPIELVSVADGPTVHGFPHRRNHRQVTLLRPEIPLIAGFLGRCGSIRIPPEPLCPVCMSDSTHIDNKSLPAASVEMLLDSPERSCRDLTCTPSEVQVLNASQWEVYLSDIGKLKLPTPASDPAGPSWTIN